VRIVRDPASLREALAPFAGRVVGLVPTMGAFHEGHLSLMRKAREECDAVVVSLFVNPTQFGPSEDLARYPRDEEHDAAMAKAERVEILYAPTPGVMYPKGFATSVQVAGLSFLLEGAHRPTHFAGVATVVAKLFTQVAPRRAYFGEKDWQQVVVVRRMAADLDLPVTIVPCPTVRDADGLALSSRNAYLGAADRGVALRLSRALFAVEKLAARGVTDVATLRDAAMEMLDDPALALDYLAFVGQDYLEDVAAVTGPTRVLVAAKIGATRLIDNVRIVPPIAGR
jgi:pantoate--beta-alanine ligase